MTTLTILIPPLAQCQALVREKAQLCAALFNGLTPLEHKAQDAMLRIHLMSNGAAGAVLGAILYSWMTRRDVPNIVSAHKI